MLKKINTFTFWCMIIPLDPHVVYTWGGYQPKVSTLKFVLARVVGCNQYVSPFQWLTSLYLPLIQALRHSVFKNTLRLELASTMSPHILKHKCNILRIENATHLILVMRIPAMFTSYTTIVILRVKGPYNSSSPLFTPRHLVCHNTIMYWECSTLDDNYPIYTLVLDVWPCCLYSCVTISLLTYYYVVSMAFN